MIKELTFANTNELVECNSPEAAVFANFFLKDWLGEMGNAVVITKNSGENQVGEGGKCGAKKEGQEHGGRALCLPNVVKVKNIFSEGKSKGGHDKKLNGIIDIYNVVAIGNFD